MKRWLLLGVLLIIGLTLFLRSTPQTKVASKTQTESTDAVVGQMTTRQKILSLMVLHQPGTKDEDLVPFIKKYQPAGIILMSDNIAGDLSTLLPLTTQLQNVAAHPLLIAIDQEGCSVKRIQQDTFPCASDLKDNPVNKTNDAFSHRSTMLQTLGINLNFGIVADITKDKDSFIYPRVFGDDPLEAGDRVAEAVKATQGKTLSTIKHFPGHGQTADDSHTSIPQVNITYDEWKKLDAIPFQKGIAAKADMVMFSHLLYTEVDTVPASLSHKWHEVLINDLGYKGISITDDMIMLKKSNLPIYQDNAKNAIRALQAGNDILLYVNEYNLEKESERKVDIETLVADIEKAVKSGEISEQSLNERVKKVLTLRATLK